MYRSQGSRPSPRKRNAKRGSQETPGVTGKFGLGVENEVGQRLIEFCKENALGTANTLFQQHKRRLYTWHPPAKLPGPLYFNVYKGEGAGLMVLQSSPRLTPAAEGNSCLVLDVTF